MIYYILINHQWDKAMDFFQWYTGELIADIMDDRGVDPNVRIYGVSQQTSLRGPSLEPNCDRIGNGKVG